MKPTRINFPNADGATLSARLDMPVAQHAQDHPTAYAIFAHCFTCSKNLNAVRNISRALTGAGIAVLRFDFTGLGESEGDFADTNFSSNVEDLVAAARFLKENYEAPALLIGHSLGGAAVLLAAKHIKSIEAVVTIGAPSEPVHVEHQFGEQLKTIEREGAAQVQLAGRPFFVKEQFLHDIRSTNLQTHIRELKKPLLVMHAPFDKTVSIKNAAEIYNAAFHPKSFISLDHADHLMSNKADSIYAGNMIAAWSMRYLIIKEQSADTPDSQTTSHQVVARTEAGSYTTQIKMGKHQIVADEPISIGGNDLGAGPYDLLLASLGACTGITLRMYAKRKGWDVDDVLVHLNHQKKYVDDCAFCEKPTAKLDHIEKTIEIKGNLDEKQRERMLEISKKCPVHRTLLSEVRISSELK